MSTCCLKIIFQVVTLKLNFTLERNPQRNEQQGFTPGRAAFDSQELRVGEGAGVALMPAAPQRQEITVVSAGQGVGYSH